jgi:putative SOS response-associated peptidase YedK
MCYDSEYQTKRQLKEAARLGAPKDEIDRLQLKLWKVTKKKQDMSFEEFVENLPAYYHVSGFAHPPMLFMTNYAEGSHDVGIWGFIPFWVKSLSEAYDYKKPYNSNLNIQSESMFEKRGFDVAAKHRRCAIALDAYYESHHQNKKTYPFRIFPKNEKSLWVAGLYQENELLDEKTGEKERFNSVGILTCVANDTLSKIHNNPSMVSRTGHRMLVILDENQLEKFLASYPTSQDPLEQRLFEQGILNMCQPYPEELLEYEPVRNLKDRKELPYIGNVPEIRERFHWPDLDLAKVFS